MRKISMNRVREALRLHFQLGLSVTSNNSRSATWDYIKRYTNTLNPSLGQVHISGEKIFVDYSGLTMPIANTKTGKK